MIFLRLFWVFLRIGLFTFGGGYAMVALIQDAVVAEYGWLTQTEFTDILAISQMTPGPFGINVATYTGYTAVVDAGLGVWSGVAGALLASFGVICVPFLLMMMLLRLLHRYGGAEWLKTALMVVRLAALGLIASAAVRLINVESFGIAGWNRRFVASVVVACLVFALSVIPRNCELRCFGRRFVVNPPSPIALLLLAGVFGFLFYM